MTEDEQWEFPNSYITLKDFVLKAAFIIETIENLFQKILLAHTFHNNYILSMIYLVE